MKYILIMTEGSDEKEFLDILLERGLLKYSKSELLMEEIFHSRQIDTNIMAYIQLLPNGNTVEIYRVWDKLSDELKVPSRILPEKIYAKYDVCTLPEFEILYIINDGYYDEYQKVKSNQKASSFYKSKNKKYSKRASFVDTYFSDMSNERIIDLINEYVKKHGRVHNKNQYNLRCLLK